jgi:methanogenic corrinoid protein MtbC1
MMVPAPQSAPGRAEKAKPGMQSEALMERFFTALISGQRETARTVVQELYAGGCKPEQVVSELFWPTLDHVQTLHRNDQLSDLAHHYATRLLRGLVDQIQLRLAKAPARGKKVLLICGPEEPEELAGQMAADMLEAAGYEIYFLGGGVANDEIVAQTGELNADVLCVFGAAASTVPFTRQLIDRLHDIGSCPKLQIVVGGGVFNRAEGLAEEIGADVWASTPEELVAQMGEHPEQRMDDQQRTVGRKHRKTRNAA